MKKNYWLLIAFLLFLFGFLSIIMTILGLQFSFLMWLDRLPALPSFLIKLVSLISGIVIAYLTTSNWKEQ